MFKNLRLGIFIGMVALAMVLVACGGEESGEAEHELELELGEESLTVPYVAWARETISKHLLAAILEEVGYDVVVSQVLAGSIVDSVIDGKCGYNGISLCGL